jgi:hypothetical protein
MPGSRGNAQSVVIEDLSCPPLTRVEVADEATGRHLVELDASKLPQVLTALRSEALGFTHGGTQRRFELTLFAVQLADCILNRR